MRTDTVKSCCIDNRINMGDAGTGITLYLIETKLHGIVNP